MKQERAANRPARHRPCTKSSYLLMPCPPTPPSAVSAAEMADTESRLSKWSITDAGKYTDMQEVAHYEAALDQAHEKIKQLERFKDFVGKHHVEAYRHTEEALQAPSPPKFATVWQTIMTTPFTSECAQVVPQPQEHSDVHVPCAVAPIPLSMPLGSATKRAISASDPSGSSPPHKQHHRNRNANDPERIAKNRGKIDRALQILEQYVVCFADAKLPTRDLMPGKDKQDFEKHKSKMTTLDARMRSLQPDADNFDEAFSAMKAEKSSMVSEIEMSAYAGILDDACGFKRQIFALKGSHALITGSLKKPLHHPIAARLN